MALFAILEALGIGPGDEVIIPGFTCVVVPNAILYRGARPRYVDIDLRTFNIDPGRIEAAINPRTKALYAQHTFGLVCDIARIREIGRKHGLPVIEDAAHALGASFEGNPVGSLTEAAFFSTDSTKVINTRLGGVATTRDPRLDAALQRIHDATPWLSADRVRNIMRDFLAAVPSADPRFYWLGYLVNSLRGRCRRIFSFDDELETSRPTRYPYPTRLSSFQAEIGNLQLETLDANLAHRCAIGTALEERFGVLVGLLAPGASNHAFLRYSFLVKDRAKVEARFAHNYELNVWFTSVLHGRSAGFERVGYTAGSCPNAEFAAAHVVNFPTHPRIDSEHLLSRVDGNLTWLRDELIRP